MVARSKQAQYERLNGKYLQEARELLKKGDYAQASEKLWGATAEIIKAVAAKRGKPLGTHRSIAEFVNALATRRPEWGLRDAYIVATGLHTNFYEDHLPPEMVERGAQVIEEFVAKLRAVL